MASRVDQVELDVLYLDQTDPGSWLSRLLQDAVYGCSLSWWPGVLELTVLLARTKQFQVLDLAGGVLSA